MKHTNQSQGFTLIELLVVIAIIGLLTSTVLASLSRVRVVARDTARLAEAQELMKAVEIYRLKYGGYPCSESNTSVTDVNCPSTKQVVALFVEIKNQGSAPTVNQQAVYNAIGYHPSPDILSKSTLLYSVRRNASGGEPDRSGYTIAVGSETKSPDGSGEYPSVWSGVTNVGYCRISTGAPDSLLVIGDAGPQGGILVQSLPTCPIPGITP